MKVINADMVILGGGIAGLIAQYYFPDAVLISDRIGGQLKAKFPAGPRYMHDGPHTKEFLEEFLPYWKIDVKRINIGYYYDKSLHQDITPELKKSYLIKTRGEKGVMKEDIMSSGKNSFNILSMKPSVKGHLWDWFYKNHDEKMVRGRIKEICHDWIDVDSWRDLKKLGIVRVYYRIMISTIPRLVYALLSKEHLPEVIEERYKTKSTTFYHIAMDKTIDKTFYRIKKDKSCDYTYFPEEEVPFHRTTKATSEKMILESSNDNLGCWSKICFNNLIMRIKDKFTLPRAQIVNSLEREPIKSPQRIFHIGRYAEHCHKVKLEEVVERVKQLKEILG